MLFPPALRAARSLWFEDALMRFMGGFCPVEEGTIAQLWGRHGFDVGRETLGVHAEAQGSS